MMHIKEIIHKVGGPVKLAKAIGINHAAVCRWKVLPIHRLLEVERITGIPREELRPDIFLKERIER
ncbi:transcriptional regulator [Commensalibacter melissae]|uniref:transcriptional regulator n=1 Tax=Commensalibacter melissae TaxID=2070537 RepID=UPI000EFCBC61|nr:Cro/CI family transcriptional regulator [Commensalibacter melissae]AYN86268.1 hypothetical protein D9V35_01525 [Commensalibacter melissae]MUG77229.1 hypothetical protein [Commensalibacter melissae]